MTPLVRRRTTWAAAAAVAVLAVTPLVVRELDSDRSAPLPPATNAPTDGPTGEPDSLTGDLDGDGYDDTVTIDAHGVISVVLAASNSGTPLTADAGADGSTLTGLAWIDDSGSQAVAADDRGTGRIFRVTADGLVQVEVVGGQFFYPFTDNDSAQTWWVDGYLMTAVDTGQAGIWQASGWLLNAAGKLDSKLRGEYCAGPAHPAPCGGGSGVYDKDGLQVALFPKASVVPAGESLPISIDGGGGPGSITLDGSTLAVDFPGGSPAEQVTIPGDGTNELMDTFLQGVEVPGIVVRRTGSDGYVTFIIVTWRAGHLTVLDTGDQVSSWDDHTSWLATNGRLFTMSPHINRDGAAVQEWTMTETGAVASDILDNDETPRSICFEGERYSFC